MGRIVPLSLLVSALIIESLAAAEPWDPKIHVRPRTYVAPRIAERIPRPLSKRQTAQKPGQPLRAAPEDKILGYEVVGQSGVSAQQLFLGDKNKVYIIDKVEGNAAQVNDHSAWAVEYNIDTNQFKTLEIVTNSFCAGGGVLGTGDWVNIGGNEAVDPLGGTSPSQTGDNPYRNKDGGFAVRTIFPGDGAEWYDDPASDLVTRRWYPTLETIETGRIFIFGGSKTGGFVNDANMNNPTYEFFPRAAGETAQPSLLLENTLPANLFPILNLMPTGDFLVSINQNAAIINYKNYTEHPLPNVPHAVRTYPASAATAMLPMTVANKWLGTVLYCGGSDIDPARWHSGDALINIAASDSCIRMTPETSNEWEEDDSLPEGRVMGNAVLLPDGTIFVGNGANTGVSGYGNDAWALQDSYANTPVYSPLLYNPTKPLGSRWSRDGLKDSTVARMYHSSATLLPDGSVFISGSNPHQDVNLEAIFPTEYAVERFYPAYYNKRRPEPSGIPTTLTYGGKYFNLELTKDDLFGNTANAKAVSVVVIRTGFSTHAINFGQRLVELDHTFTTKSDGGVTLHVSQVPPNAAMLQPGPAWFFVVVNGVPSIGVQVMVGSGKIGDQEMLTVESLPDSSSVDGAPDQNHQNGSSSLSPLSSTLLALFLSIAVLFTQQL